MSRQSAKCDKEKWPNSKPEGSGSSWLEMRQSRPEGWPWPVYSFCSKSTSSTSWICFCWQWRCPLKIGDQSSGVLYFNILYSTEMIETATTKLATTETVPAETATAANDAAMAKKAQRGKLTIGYGSVDRWMMDDEGWRIQKVFWYYILYPSLSLNLPISLLHFSYTHRYWYCSAAATATALVCGLTKTIWIYPHTYVVCPPITIVTMLYYSFVPLASHERDHTYSIEGKRNSFQGDSLQCGWVWRQ